mmetsp:Transcript_19858/g.47908  ORF Transcript_19858/g.47908 Transcript_19858/m.47908 type:complete len:224 (-) Transcript_19858:495-1166(-)
MLRSFVVTATPRLHAISLTTSLRSLTTRTHRAPEGSRALRSHTLSVQSLDPDTTQLPHDASAHTASPCAQMVATSSHVSVSHTRNAPSLCPVTKRPCGTNLTRPPPAPSPPTGPEHTAMLSTGLSASSLRSAVSAPPSRFQTWAQPEVLLKTTLLLHTIMLSTGAATPSEKTRTQLRPAVLHSLMLRSHDPLRKLSPHCWRDMTASVCPTRGSSWHWVARHQA